MRATARTGALEREERLAGGALAVWRLASFATLTCVATLRLAWACRGTPVSPQIVARHGQRWARGVNRRLGLLVQVRGDVPRETAILVANHRSYADITALLQVVPCLFMAKVELAGWPVLGRAARLGGAIFVDRSSSTSRGSSLRQMMTALRRGASVAVFAEGTTTSPPALAPFSRGAFDVAARTGAALVPIAIAYLSPDDAWVGDDTFVAHFMRRFRHRAMSVTVSFGPAMRSSDASFLRDQAVSWIASSLGVPLPRDVERGGARRARPQEDEDAQPLALSDRSAEAAG